MSPFLFACIVSLFNLSPFRRRLLEQQNAARGLLSQQAQSGLAGMMSGGNILSTPNGISRGLGSMSPAPQQLARPRKI